MGSVSLVGVQVVLIAAFVEVASLTVQVGVGEVLSNKNATGKKILTKPDVPRSPLELV